MALPWEPGYYDIAKRLDVSLYHHDDDANVLPGPLALIRISFLAYTRGIPLSLRRAKSEDRSAHYTQSIRVCGSRCPERSTHGSYQTIFPQARLRSHCAISLSFSVSLPCVFFIGLSGSKDRNPQEPFDVEIEWTDLSSQNP